MNSKEIAAMIGKRVWLESGLSAYLLDHFA